MFATYIALISSAWLATPAADTQNPGDAMTPPPVDQPLPVPKASQWEAGTADASHVTYPHFRSTDDPIVPVKENFIPGPFALDTGEPRFIPSGKNEAPAIHDTSVFWEPDAPPVLQSFQGQGPNGWIPPDPHLAVARNYIVLCVNDDWAIYDKCGNELFTVDTNTWFGVADRQFFDPKVIYDPWNGRWVMLWHAKNEAAEESELYMVISDDSNPNGNWWWYAFPAEVGAGGDRSWADYCDLGYGPAAVYLSGNWFRFSGGFFTSQFRTYDKGQIYAAAGAVQRIDTGLMNPDGSTCTTPRAAHMQAVFGGFDGMFINARSGGGNRLTLWKLTDPLGAHTLTSVDIAVGDYDVAPSAVQPNGQLLDTINCRLMNCVVTSNPAVSEFYLFTGNQDSVLWSGDTDPRAACHLFVLDPSANTVRFDRVFGAGRFYYWFPSAGADYQPCGLWNFTRCGIDPGNFASMRFVDWDRGTFSNSSGNIKAGEGNYGGFRWGDYFQGCLDWGDYGGATTKQKIWMYGEYAIVNSWRAWAAASACNAVAGTLTLTPGTGFASSGYQGGPFAPVDKVYTLGNTGEVGYNYEVTGLPAWLTASSIYGEVPAGANVAVTLSVNAAANALAPGIYNATVRLANCYNNAGGNRAATLRVGQIVLPTSFSLFRGVLVSGNLVSLQAPDNNRMVLRPGPVLNQLERPIQLIVEGTASFATATNMILVVEAHTNIPNLSQWVDAYNFSTNTYTLLDQRNMPQSDLRLELTVPNPGQHISAAGLLRARVSYKEAGPVFSYPWFARIDETTWKVIP